MHTNKPLLVYTHGAGRLGNQLFAYAHFVAFLEENPEIFDFINITFIPYTNLLKYTCRPFGYHYPTQHHRRTIFDALVPLMEADASSGFNSTLQRKLIANCTRLLHLYGSALPQGQSLLVRDSWSFISGKRLESLDLAAPETVALLKGKSVTIVGGWGIRSWSLLEKHSTVVREAMAVHPQYEAIARQFIETLRQQYDFLIGVMIRQGDYRSSAEIYRRFLFETDRYACWMHQAQQVYGDKGKIGFVVASDESQSLHHFNGLNVHFGTGTVGGGHYVESLRELSLCDVIMTSATTFGCWAGFLGNIPIIPLSDSAQTIEQSSAQPYLDALKLFDALGNKCV